MTIINKCRSATDDSPTISKLLQMLSYMFYYLILIQYHIPVALHAMMPPCLLHDN